MVLEGKYVGTGTKGTHVELCKTCTTEIVARNLKKKGRKKGKEKKEKEEFKEATY